MKYKVGDNFLIPVEITAIDADYQGKHHAMIGIGYVVLHIYIWILNQL